MAKMSLHHDVVAFITKSLPQSFLRVQGYAVLVKICFFKVFADTHRTAVWLQTLGQKLNEGCLAGAVRPDNPNFIALDNAGRKVFDNLALAKSFCDMLGFNHQFGAEIPLIDIKIDVTDLLDLFTPFGPELLEPAQPPHIAAPSGRDSFVKPLGFFGNFAVEVILLNNLLINDLLLPFFKEFESLIVSMHFAAVKPKSGSRGVR